MENNNNEKQNYVGADLTPWSWAWISVRTRRHIADTARLALPIILSRLAISFLVVVDTMMVLRYSKEHNQWLTLGSGPADAFFGLALGITVGVPILVSRYYGARQYEKIGNIWRQSLLWSLITGSIITLLCLVLAPWVLKAGNTAIVSKAFGITTIYALSFIPSMIWLVGSGVLEGTEKPNPVLILALLGNVVNILFNWFFVYGIWVFPELGAYGSALATFLVRTFMALLTCYYVLTLKEAQKYNIRSWFIGKFSQWKELRILGYATAVSVFLESACFASLNMFSTRKPLTLVDTGAWIINFRILGTIFMIALALATATSVRVGIARGRRDFNDQIFALIIGVILTLLALIFLSGMVTIFSQDIARIFSKDTEIILYAASFMIYLLWLFIPDGMQATLSASLRTSGIVWPTTILSSFSYGILTPILAYYLAFPLGRGIQAFFEALIIASWFICIAYFLLLLINYKKIKATTEAGEE